LIRQKVADPLEDILSACGLTQKAEVSRIEVLVDPSVTFPRQSFATATRQLQSSMASSLRIIATHYLEGGMENATLLVFIETPAIAESIGRR
jgi:hypothetical protein